MTDCDGASRTPDGGIVSTVYDLATFIEAVFDGRLLAKEALKEMTSNMLAEKRYNLGTYGLGIFKVVLGNGQIMYGHGGGHQGYSAELWYVPEKKRTFAYLANGSKFRGPSADALSRLLLRTSARLMVDRPGKVRVTTLPSLTAACIRIRVASGKDQAARWKELGDCLKQQRIEASAPGYTIYHDVSSQESDIEIVQPVEKAGADSGRIKFVRTEPVQVATVVAQGAQDSVDQSYKLLNEWISANGYAKVGPSRESYYRRDQNEGNPQLWLTEIQLPVERLSGPGD